MLFRYCTLHDIMKLKLLWAGLYASFKIPMCISHIWNTGQWWNFQTPTMYIFHTKHIFASHCSHRQSFTSAPVHLQWMDDLVAHSLRLVTPNGNKSWSTLVQVMACGLTASSHDLNQCWHDNIGLLPRRDSYIKHPIFLPKSPLKNTFL